MNTYHSYYRNEYTQVPCAARSLEKNRIESLMSMFLFFLKKGQDIVLCKAVIPQSKRSDQEYILGEMYKETHSA